MHLTRLQPAATALLLAAGVAAGAEFPGWRLKPDALGQQIPQPRSVDPTLLNPEHSAAWRDGYHSRIREIIDLSLQRPFGFNTYFENEKHGLGQAMLRVLGGDLDNALVKLSSRDANASEWHRETEGIDYYACFTLKHQPRKYFYFGELLPPAYLKQMRDGARKWTASDPLRRPHYAYQPGSSGWTPVAKNSWVDVRTTDNLTLMRQTAVYLMAEETGNDDVARLYKDRFARFVKAVYRTGNGEWDSENYLGHTVAPVHNLYDFAKDPQVRGLAKALLDWLYTAMAVKYYRGGANGPTKRDYNHCQPFGGSLAIMGYTYFGAPVRLADFEVDPDYDQIHQVTSAYVPPPAVIDLAQNNFARPRELFNSKAPYSEPQAGRWDFAPAYHETYFVGNTFELGSLAEGTGNSDVNGFKLLAWDGERGVADFQLVPGPDPHYVGSPKYTDGKLAGPNRVAQFRNSALWLVKNGEAPWIWVLPAKVTLAQAGGVTFFRADRTTVAVHPLNTTAFAPDADLTRQVQVSVKKTRNKQTKQEELVESPRWPEHRAVSAHGKGGSFCGVAVEVQDTPTSVEYESFKQATLGKARLEASQLQAGTVTFTTSRGDTLAATWGDELADFKVRRNGALHDWQRHGQCVYREVDSETSGLVYQRWGDAGGTLQVNTGEHAFTCTVTEDGRVTFENR